MPVKEKERIETDQLTDLETIAVSKAVKETAVKDARPRLTVGGHAVDFTVRISGPLLVAPRAPTTIKEDVPAEVLLGLIVEKLSRRARVEVSEWLDRELAGWRAEVEELPELEADTRVRVATMLAHGHRERRGEKNGNVTAPLSVELVSRG